MANSPVQLPPPTTAASANIAGPALSNDRLRVLLLLQRNELLMYKVLCLQQGLRIRKQSKQLMAQDMYESEIKILKQVKKENEEEIENLRSMLTQGAVDGTCTPQTVESLKSQVRWDLMRYFDTIFDNSVVTPPGCRG